MNIKGIKAITAIILATCLAACQKQEVVTAQPDEVTINISSPQEGTIYKKGDTVYISAHISYITQMHGYIVQITDDAGDVVFEAEGHTHGDNITVAEKWGDTLSETRELSLAITAVVDHDGNQKISNVGFESQP
ncbi:MAG: hypothetical protein KDC07_06875 [Chitinophagaceae bacterium]|nr:hypothetical protein [Chitinophagaceae bacterium]MCB9047024.1 hypothetical protein [Chitinophagales bacterium]